VTDESLVEVIEELDDRCVTASEVAEEVEIGRAGTLKRLNNLYEKDVIERKPVGAHAVVWWVP